MFCASTLKKEAGVEAENLAITYKTERCHNPQRQNPELVFSCCRSSLFFSSQKSNFSLIISFE